MKRSQPCIKSAASGPSPITSSTAQHFCKRRTTANLWSRKVPVYQPLHQGWLITHILLHCASDGLHRQYWASGRSLGTANTLPTRSASTYRKLVLQIEQHPPEVTNAAKNTSWEESEGSASLTIVSAGKKRQWQEQLLHAVNFITLYHTCVLPCTRRCLWHQPFHWEARLYRKCSESNASQTVFWSGTIDVLNPPCRTCKVLYRLFS